MIVRPARGSHICLRCQRGLAKRANASVSQTASQSTDSRPKQPSERPLRRKVVDADVDYTNNPNLSRGIGSALDKGFRNGVGGGLHGHRGLQVQENREPLNRTTLGDPADVLVLRDSILTLYAAGGPRSMEAIQPEHIDILSQLEEERGLVGQKEVESNIDAFRPANERQSWEDINELVKELQDGFTMSQLQRYIRNFQGRQEPESPLQEWITSKEDAKILRVTPWLPGVSEIQEHFDNDPLRGYFLPSHTAKQRVVLQLLRECWMLELPELVDGIGQFEIEVSQEDLELLLMGQTSVLDHIHSEQLHQENEKLEAFRKRSVIRVTGPHVKKPFIVQEIEAALKRVRREIVSLKDLMPYSSDKYQQRRVDKWADRNFDPATIQALGRLTNTSIVQQQNKSLVISCIDTNQHSLASSVDVARRLLLTSSRPTDRVEHQLVSEETLLKKGAFIRHEVGNTVPWRDRLREWSRWTAPTTKEKVKMEEPVTAKPVLVFKSERGEQKGKSEAEAEINNAPTYVPTHWNGKYFSETSAIFGKILHSNTNANPPNSPPIPLTIKGNNLFHTFSTQVSNLSRVLSKSQVSLGHERTDRLVLRFLPNPFVKTSKSRRGKSAEKKSVKTRAIGAEALSAFPIIEMRFKIDPITNHATLQDVQAIVQESKTDVLLPHNNTDVRFQQRTTSRLYARSIKPIHEYLKRSNLSLKGSGILQTPPSICIPIEKHLCRGQGFKLLDELDSLGNPFTDTDVRDVEYLFAGLEIRSSLIFEYDSWRLFYTSIEAGKAGGHRAELKLRPILGGNIADESAFISQAYKLASEIGDQDPESLVPQIFIRPRRVRNSVEDSVVRRTASEAPDEQYQSHFEYFVKRITLGPGPDGERLASERVGTDEQSVDPYREAVVEEEEQLSEEDKHASTEEQEKLDGERATEELEDDLKKIEDDRI